MAIYHGASSDHLTVTVPTVTQAFIKTARSLISDSIGGSFINNYSITVLKPFAMPISFPLYARSKLTLTQLCSHVIITGSSLSGRVTLTLITILLQVQDDGDNNNNNNNILF